MKVTSILFFLLGAALASPAPAPEKRNMVTREVLDAMLSIRSPQSYNCEVVYTVAILMASPLVLPAAYRLAFYLKTESKTENLE
jgi:hypothetical protein